MLIRAVFVLLASLSITGCGGAACPKAPAPPSDQPQACPECEQPSSDSGLVTVASRNDFATTVTKLEQAIAAKGLTIMARVDHAANATKAALDLPPTTVLIFGNPKVGTKLMKQSRTVAIDLPLKMLVWQTDDGTVEVVFNEANGLATRHGIDSAAELVSKVQGALASLASAASE